MSLKCPYCFKQNPSAESRTFIVHFGSFLRKRDGQSLQRYLCKSCQRTFSSASPHPCYRQKKRDLNPVLFQLFNSGVSQRRLARVLKINRKTVVRKYLFLGLWAERALELHRSLQEPALEVEFDDLETFEHSKLKPLSVTVAVESKTRRMLGFRVAQMPAKGLLVQKALKKYGVRKDHRKRLREELFKELQEHIHPKAVIKSDENPHYPSTVRRYFPKATHKTYPGRRGCVVGQGELKAGGYDPLFSLNHSLAMMRANINRLFRRTWNTTKKKERLSIAVSLYALYHNLELIKNPST